MGLFNPDIMHRTLRGNGYHSTDMLFSFTCAFVNKDTGYAADGGLTKVSSL